MAKKGKKKSAREGNPPAATPEEKASKSEQNRDVEGNSGEENADPFDFGGLPVRDLKKNLGGCG